MRSKVMVCYIMCHVCIDKGIEGLRGMLLHMFTLLILRDFWGNVTVVIDIHIGMGGKGDRIMRPP